MGKVRRWLGVVGAALALAVAGAACAPAGPGVGSASCGMHTLSQRVLVDLNGARTSNGPPPWPPTGS